MPLYEYECQQCKRHTEKIQKFSDAEITTCPHCGGVLQRVITAPAIAFKGGGWYKDGYGNAKPASASAGESGGTTAAAGDSGATSAPGASVGSSGGDSSPAPSSAPAAPVSSPTPASSSTGSEKK